MGEFADRHGSGSSRRRIRLLALDHQRVRAGVEDDMHHYECVLHHDGERVLGWSVDPVRTPWSPCDDSATGLELLVGRPLTTSATAVASGIDVRLQCTHLFDLAVLAVAHAARRGTYRQYDATVPDWHAPPFDATLERNSVTVLSWRLGSHAEVHGPPAFAGLSLRGGFVRWTEQRLHPELAEAAQVLRRAVWLSPARLQDLEGCDDATESGLTPGVCYTAQPERMGHALRNRHTLRDHGPSAEPMLEHPVWPRTPQV